MNNKIKVYVLADGHYNSLGLVRSLGQCGYFPIVFLIGVPDAIVKYSRYVKDRILCDNINQALEILKSEYSHLPGQKFIMTGNDKFVSAIDNSYEELKDYFITYNCGMAGNLNKFLSKAIQNELAREVGFNVPEYVIVNVNDKNIPNIPFPVITKAINSIGRHWKDIVFICKDKEELLEAYDKIDCEQILVQHYIKKHNETGFNGISINGGKEVYLPLQLKYKTISDTTFGNVIHLFKPKQEDIIEKIKSLIKKTGYTGSFSVDFLIAENLQTYFLEINFRNSGWSYPYTCAGANLPVIWLESMIKGCLDNSREKINKLPYTVADEFKEAYDNSKRGVFKFLSTIYKLFQYDGLIYWDVKDRNPFKHLMASMIKTHLFFTKFH